MSKLSVIDAHMAGENRSREFTSSASTSFGESPAFPTLQRVEQDMLSEIAEVEALKLLESFDPQVLVSNIGKPEWDGYDAHPRGPRARGRTSKDLPAVALTAFVRSEDRRRARLAGFQTHVAKPVDPDEVVAVVGSLAGRTCGANN